MYGIILIIIIFIIIIIGDNLEKYNNYTDNNKIYRLADMVKSAYWRSKKTGYTYHLINFKDSIATEYMKLTKRENDVDVLNSIINRRTTCYHLKFKKYIIWHLRTGDVIDNTNRTVKDFLNKELEYHNGIVYVKPIKYYKGIIDNLYNSVSNKKILLITGFHKNMNNTKSLKYIDSVVKYFKKLGYHIKTRINNNPDDDFIIMCNSNHFIRSAGGFSNLIGSIISNRGGDVH
jgi:hypothetical protein